MAQRTPWGDNAPRSPRQARRRLVDAAEACFSRFGVTKTTVDDVASEAAVSRATVYRYFPGGRDELVLAVLMDELGRYLDSLRAQIAAEETLADAIVEGVLETLAEIERNPHLAVLFTREVAGTTGAIAGAAEALFSATTEFLRPFLAPAAADGRLRAGLAIEDVAEWIVRVILSLLTVRGPRQRTPDETRTLLRHFVVAALVAED